MRFSPSRRFFLISRAIIGQAIKKFCHNGLVLFGLFCGIQTFEPVFYQNRNFHTIKRVPPFKKRAATRRKKYKMFLS